MNFVDTYSKRHESHNDPETGQDPDLAAPISNDGSDPLGYSGLDPCDRGTVDVPSRSVSAIEIVIGGAGSWEWIGTELGHIGAASVDGGVCEDTLKPSTTFAGEDLAAVDLIMAQWARSDPFAAITEHK